MADARKSDQQDFRQVFAAELAAIDFRRKALRERLGAERAYIEPRNVASLLPDGAADGTVRVSDGSDLSGLALSGGGIRSASFSLGVLQALDSLAPNDKPQVIDALDYLSTVSGGGYIGGSLVAGLSEKGHHDFPFTSRLDSEETPEVQHLRDFSNFIAPNGVMDLIVALATVIRGLIVNAVTVLPFLLGLALLTILSNPNKGLLGVPDILGYPLSNLPHISIPGFEPFSLTITLAAVVLTLMFFSAIVVSLSDRTAALPLRENLGRSMGVAFVVIAIVAVFEAQPFVLAAMLNTPVAAATDNTGLLQGDVQTANDLITGFLGFFGKIAPQLAAVLGPVAIALIALGQKLANIARANVGESGLKPVITKWSSRLTLYLAAIIVPLLLWTAYIYLSYWGIWDRITLGGCQTNAPPFLQQIAGCDFTPGLNPHGWGYGPFGTIGNAYLLAFIVLVLLGLLIGPNANSLHYLYRDRISRAFLMDRKALSAAKLKDQGKRDVDTEKFSSLKPSSAPPEGPYDAQSFAEDAQYSPYFLVNAAINIEGSEKLNRRGRNADTFLFSPLFVGNRFTGYIPTRRLEGVETEFGLASAMAISGAAASANMGRATIKPLTFSLALLNIRLGFWFPNPARIADFDNPLWKRVARTGIWQFFLEAFGRLDERALNVYLTDGGHVENLGIYELIKRRCKVIIAVDSDLDPALSFPSLVGLEMMARIDLGARIEVPWQDLQAAGTAVTDAELHGADRKDYPSGCGPHAAIGIIRYDDKNSGVLIHIKSMLTGDENDYILDYKRRNGTFPHETTLDQFFSEEQFEVYRSLGFHAARQFFTGAEGFGSQIRNAPKDWQEQVRHALRVLNVPEEMVGRIVARIRVASTLGDATAAATADNEAKTGALMPA